MRKLAWFFLIATFTIMLLIIGGLAYAPFGEGLHYAFVEVIGLGTLNLIVGALTGLFLWGSANGLQATAVLATLWIIGGVMWLVIKKYAWDRRPSIMKTAEAKIYQHEPVASIPQVTPEPVPQVIKPEEPKQETAAQ